MNSKLVVMVLVGGIVAASAQVFIRKHGPEMPNPLNGAAEEAMYRQQRIYNTTYVDGWRIVNGITNQVTDKWTQFSGHVVEVQPGGLRLVGHYFCPTDYTGLQNFTGEFFVADFPYPVAQGDYLGGLQIFRALPGGVYKYYTVEGGTRTLHQLNYWAPCEAPPKSPEQIAAERERDRRSKAASIAAALKSNQEQAAAGDAYGQLRMAERYRDGDGVEINLIKAKFLFLKSADQGNAQAARELEALPQVRTNLFKQGYKESPDGTFALDPERAPAAGVLEKSSSGDQL